ncbi:restriction endonuclease [Marilutibacter alkalisoli]|uniref:Restriction endonuclease n=1 Tax=Marilutibacter alkalisoli TaxID=2591633 RepID=A0A514BRW4_9GAMM|nr:restriction endonuclease [Lysobacter alkalisoli]QDH70134.1 restriction endonuclease [Lysobacter alkalisoli]
MLTASTVITSLGIATVIGMALALYLWRIRRPQLLVQRGLAALATMRWREYSGFIVEALHAQGFEAIGSGTPPQGAGKTDLCLSRDGSNWLLSCRQSPDHGIDAAHLAGFAGTVRAQEAAGGIIATLGTVQKDARDNVHGIELLHGESLWMLVEPLLPAGLRHELAEAVRKRAVVEAVLACGLALLAGFTIALAVAGVPADPPSPAAPAPEPTPQPVPASAPRPEQPPPAEASPEPSASAPVAAAAAADGVDEETQRKRITERVGELVGIKRAVWSTRSTLVVFLDDSIPDGPELTRPICDVLSDYPALRSSRLQLEPPEGSDRRVRFLQCHAW